MKLRNKLIIILFLCALLVTTSIGAVVLYYYIHPDAVKPLIEKTVSSYTGMACTVRTLSYSLDPLTVKADSIILEPIKDRPGPRLEMSGLSADMAFVGPFGRKTLTLKGFNIQKLLLHFPEKFVLPEIRRGQGARSLPSQILGWALTRCLFRDIAFEEAALLDGRITFAFEEQKIEVKGLRANLNPDHRIRISCNMFLEWPSRNLLLTAPEIHITTQDAISLKDPQITGLLELNNATIHSPEIDVDHMACKSTILYFIKNRELRFEPMAFQLDGARLKHELDGPWPPVRAKVRMQGSFDIQNRKLRVTGLDLNAHDTLELKGRIDTEIGTQTAFRLDVSDGYLSADNLHTLLPHRIMEGLPVTVSDPIHFTGEVSGRREQAKWGLRADLHATLDRNKITYANDQMPFHATLSGQIDVSGDIPKLKLSADLKGEQIKMGFGAKDFLMKQARIELSKGEINIGTLSLFLPEIHLDTSLLKNISASVECDQGLPVFRLQGQDVGLIESAHMLELLPSKWQLAGRADLDIRAMQNKEEKWIFSSHINIHQLAFEGPNGDIFGEGISLLLDTEGNFNPMISQAAFSTTLSAKEGELLLDRFYLDLSVNGLDSSLEGIYDMSQQNLVQSTHHVDLKDILRLTSSGILRFKAENPQIDLRVNIPKTALKPIFHHFILEPFQTEKPFLASLDLAGHISADLHVNGSMSEWSVKGHSMWNEGRFASSENGFSLSGIELRLPIWLKSIKPAPLSQRKKGIVGRDIFNDEEEDEGLRGTVVIQRINAFILNDQSLKLSLRIEPNRLSVEEPTLLRIPGGVVEVGPILFENVISPKRRIKTSLLLEEIDPTPLISGLLPMPVHGSITGHLDTVHLEDGILKSSGQIRAKIFGGEVLMSDLAVSGLFSSFPLYRMNVDIRNLNLSELTKGTSFGEIEGVLDGHVHQLEIAHAQPQKFDLLLETVKTKGVDQKISIQAVDNIARIGGGGSPFMGLTGAFITLFEKLPYSKIGIRASLVNDTFRINGSDWEGGPDNLVKSGGIPRVNVVNHDSGKPIPFKKMVNRIKGVLASKSGPVIK
jgi:hypothetical protein